MRVLIGEKDSNHEMRYNNSLITQETGQLHYEFGKGFQGQFVIFMILKSHAPYVSITELEIYTE